MRGSFPTSWPNAWLAASSSALVLALAGCGGDDGGEPQGPAIDGPTADQLADRSERIADLADAGDMCGAAQEADALVDEAEAAVGEGRVPAAHQEELLARARELQSELTCDAPPPPPPMPPPPPPPPADGDD